MERGTRLELAASTLGILMGVKNWSVQAPGLQLAGEMISEILVDILNHYPNMMKLHDSDSRRYLIRLTEDAKDPIQQIHDTGLRGQRLLGLCLTITILDQVPISTRSSAGKRSPDTDTQGGALGQGLYPHPSDATKAPRSLSLIQTRNDSTV